MNVKDAIRKIDYRIKTATKIVGKGMDGNAYEDLEMAIKALEKQMPKKPSVEGDGESNGQIVYDTWICPCCDKHYEIDYDDYDYCPNCGQHIDRSDLK